jgi:hypothetical protein
VFELFFRILKYASCSNECFILALIYIDRLIQRNNFLLTELNLHRVTITAVLLAAKFFDDAYYNNAYYSKVGGVLGSEMNGLEVDFLFRINFSLHVTPDVFEKYKAELVAHSISAGLAAAQPPSPIPEEIEAPIEMQQQLASHNVTPLVTSAPQNMSAEFATPQVAEVAAVPNPMYAPDLVMQPEFTEYMQRANSLPFPDHTGRCVESHPACNSAPMVSMVPVDADQYLMVNNQLFPLQTTLVHHNHGVEAYHEQSNFHHSHGNSYALPRGGVGSLVAGHY